MQTERAKLSFFVSLLNYRVSKTFKYRKEETTMTEKELFNRFSTANPQIADKPKEEEQQQPTAGNSIIHSDSDEHKGKGFNDVAGMENLKKLFTEGLINVLQNRECAKAYGITPPNVLLYGPSGCGKTYFAEKAAEEIGINFMKVCPDDVASSYVHGTQQKIDSLFKEAARKAPTLLLLDEYDAMAPERRADDRGLQNGEVNEWLVQLNNTAERGIYVIASSNHPERIDKAILRSGRFDEKLYVDMPDEKERESLFELSLKGLPTAEDLDYKKLASITDGYTCSDITYIVHKAARRMFNESIKHKGEPYKLITQEVVEDSVKSQSPSVSSRDIREYERIRTEISPKDENARPMHIGFC